MDRRVASYCIERQLHARLYACTVIQYMYTHTYIQTAKNKHPDNISSRFVGLRSPIINHSLIGN